MRGHRGSGKNDRRTVVEQAVGSWVFLQALADVCGGIGFRAVLRVESGNKQGAGEIGDGQRTLAAQQADGVQTVQEAGADFFAGTVTVRSDKQWRTEDTQARVTKRSDRLFQRAFHARIKEG